MIDPEEIQHASEEPAPGPEFGLHMPTPAGVAIDVRDVGIRYNLQFTKKNKLRTALSRIWHRDRQRGHFWALRHVTFRVDRGESVGVIGANGSGKSTLLLVLAGIIQPSEGVVEVNGHLSTLLSLHAGFDPDLTGRENIALAGALMGIDHKVMEEISPGIIQFASLGAFIDAPLKTYSSGMRAKLGFSIATAVDPDILLLDEVLQTGDAVFKEKSRQRIISVLKAAKAVVLVTHDMSWVTGFCTRAILLDKGRIVADGDPREVVNMHLERSRLRREGRYKERRQMKAGRAPTGSQRRPPRKKRTEEPAAR